MFCFHIIGVFSPSNPLKGAGVKNNRYGHIAGLVEVTTTAPLTVLVEKYT